MPQYAPHDGGRAFTNFLSAGQQIENIKRCLGFTDDNQVRAYAATAEGARAIETKCKMMRVTTVTRRR